MSQPDVLTSSRLAALQQALAAGETDALDAFWRDVAARGTPLIEPIADDARHVLVTFLWRADGPLDNVVVVSSLNGWGDFAHERMTRLADTDIWYKTYRVAADIRTTYQLAPNDSLVPGGETDMLDSSAGSNAWQQRTANWCVDPLNRYPFPPDEPWTSFFALPAAPAQPWITPRPGVPTGSVKKERFYSAILENERDVWVYSPPGYREDHDPYDLLLLFDGEAYGSWVPTPTILDNLLAEGLLPPVVAVMPENASYAARLRELQCSPSFLDFLTTELLPWVRERYRVTGDPARTVVGGSSLGGLTAAFAALRRPDVFGNVLAQSGSFAWKPDGDEEYEWMARQFVAASLHPLRFYLEAGRLEVDTYTRREWPQMGSLHLVANRHLRDVLRAKGYHVTYREFNGGHDYVCWQGTLSDGLIALLGDSGTEAHQ